MNYIWMLLFIFPGCYIAGRMFGMGFWKSAFDCLDQPKRSK